jgi:hypothetical protein
MPAAISRGQGTCSSMLEAMELSTHRLSGIGVCGVKPSAEHCTTAPGPALVRMTCASSWVTGLGPQPDSASTAKKIIAFLIPATVAQRHFRLQRRSYVWFQ